MKNHLKIYIVFSLTLILLFLMNLFLGSVSIPFKSVLKIISGDTERVKASWNFIIMESRLPQACTALLAGSSLAVSGLMLQTLFKNPLAGPSILGISDGANLGVALLMLAVGTFGRSASSIGLGGYISTILAALIGASIILLIILFFASKVKSNVMLLIIGIMIGYLASSLISILTYHASADKVRQFVMWGMGDFSNVSMEKLPYFSLFSLLGLLLSVLMIKPLNALLLGENYAKNLGVNIKRSRIYILLVTGLLTAIVTAFCGPIAFIGLAVPHVARLLTGSSNHKLLVPATIMAGGAIALLCNILTVIPGSNEMLPLSAITPIIGAPIIIYVIVNRKHIQYFD